MFPQADPMSPDPFDALSGMLPEAKPVPESPKLRPEEIVDVINLYYSTFTCIIAPSHALYCSVVYSVIRQCCVYCVYLGEEAESRKRCACG